MAKKSSIERNTKRKRLAASYRERRQVLKNKIMDRALAPGERFELSQALAKLPRNSAPTRIRNRCEITGRPRGYYRKVRMSRIALRDLGSSGLIPGLVKSSW